MSWDKCVPRGRRRKNENEIEKRKNEKHGDKSECVYGEIKIKLESTKVVNTVCEVCVPGEMSTWAL